MQTPSAQQIVKQEIKTENGLYMDPRSRYLSNLFHDIIPEEIFKKWKTHVSVLIL